MKLNQCNHLSSIIEHHSQNPAADIEENARKTSLDGTKCEATRRPLCLSSKIDSGKFQSDLQKSSSHASNRFTISRSKGIIGPKSAFSLERKRGAPETVGPLLSRISSGKNEPDPQTASSLTSRLLNGYNSLPNISYNSNGLKRNKSNEFNRGRNATFGQLVGSGNSKSNATFGQLGSVHSKQPNAFKEQMQNATFDLGSVNRVNKQPSKLLSSHKIHKEPVIIRSNEEPVIIRSKFEEEKVQPQEDLNPQITLVSILQEAGYKAEGRKSSELKDYFITYTEKELASYDKEAISAIRQQNIPLLRELRNNGKSLHTANSFGESLIHMACRRGFIDVVRFLIEEAEVPLRVKDDYGRTPFHDACWSPEPNFDLMALIMEKEADLLLVEDQRGHFPFSYARRNHFEQWANFLLQRREKIHLRTFK
jgi:hypothetical protein